MSHLKPTLPPGTPTLLDTPQAAAVLGFQPSTMEALRHRGGGPPFVRISSRAVRYSVAELKRWLEERTATSTAEERVRGEPARATTDVGEEAP
jgi:predicted DNA-binding transcriptional regulator AlpA